MNRDEQYKHDYNRLCLDDLREYMKSASGCFSEKESRLLGELYAEFLSRTRKEFVDRLLREDDDEKADR